MNETLKVGDLTFEIRRSNRRKTLGLTVDRGGELVIHCPESTKKDELEQWTRSKLLWVHRKLALKEELAPKVREPDFLTGERFRYLGRSYRLVTVEKQGEALSFVRGRFSLRRDQKKHGTDHFREWYTKHGQEWLSARVDFVSRRIGVRPASVRLRELGFRWGSCSKGNAVSFSWKLLQLNTRLVDYVIAHELAHLMAPHHTPPFWQILDRALPDWKQRKEELRTQVRDIYWCHPRMGWQHKA
jgi:predicted metal-dependent hydrolase